MDDYRLRPAVQADAILIRRTIAKMRLNPFGLDWRRFVVAEWLPSGEFAACGQIKPTPGGLHELASIAVLESHRGRGLARRVIRHLLDQESARPLYLTCRAELRAFYEKFGFRALDLKEMPPYYRYLSLFANLLLSLTPSQMLVMSLGQEPVEKNS